jgi:hypothetical protein
MKLLKFHIVIVLLSSVIIYSNPTDSTKIKFSDNQSIWGIKLGRFHYSGVYFHEGGVSGNFFNEHKISRNFNLGWSFQLYKTIGSNEGSASINGYLSYPFLIGNQKFYIKGGLGLAILNYLTPVAMFEVEYIVCDFEKSAISVSILQSVPGLPLTVSVGILF